uniref:Uncharacterized protein n=2 Tax=Pygocentrus nattereri TaxID=42514 RepID=A0A3B4D9Z8_PYGNA
MERFGRLKFFAIVTGKAINADKDFIRKLHKHQPNLQKVSTVEGCDVILVFCPVASRAGTDIEAALKNLNDKSATKPAVLVVLHHTFDPDSTVPDSSRAVTRRNTFTVDCLFYEDSGLLQCRKNDTALEKITQYLKLQVLQSIFIILLWFHPLCSYTCTLAMMNETLYISSALILLHCTCCNVMISLAVLTLLSL